MVISYFNYLWDIDGISAGSSIKGREFVAGLRRMGHKVYLEWRVRQPENTNGTVSENVKSKLKPYLQNYLKEPKLILKNIPQVWQEIKILKQQNPDIFFPRLEYGNISAILAARYLNIPTVIEADCPPTHEWVEFYGKNAHRVGDLSHRFERYVLNHADAVITQSNALTDYYVEQGIPAGKIHMITNAADINKFYPKPRATDIEEKYNLKNKTVIGWVGAGVSWTGIEVLVETMQQILSAHKNVALLMIGSQHNMETMREKLVNDENKDQVILAGFVPFERVPDYVSCMDVLLAPYPKFDFFYASSMKLFEYMAAGKAVVATNIGQIAEVITEGENGFLFDRDQKGELHQKLELLINNPELRAKLGAEARKLAESDYNWDRIAQKMTQVFESVLAKRNLAV